MKKLSLNILYSRFCDKSISRCKLESSIFNYYFKNQGKTCLSHWKSEEYEDFVSWFYPRLKKAIDKYNDKGITFESYMNKFFFIASKEYKVRTTVRSITEYSAWSARVPELYVHEEPPEYICENNEQIISKLIHEKNGRRNIRRVLALILKCYNYVSYDFIEKAAPMLNIEKEELNNMINKIRTLRQKKDDMIYNLKERLYCQYYKCIVLEKRLSLAKENTTAYNKLNNQIKNARLKLEKTRAKFNLIRKDATNSQVAEVIGVSKGSIDSGLHRLKEKISLN